MSEMFADLLAVQKEMPKLQKSAINPHFGNKYVPLEDLLDAVLPILNAHNFVLLQLPMGIADAVGALHPALHYRLVHASGEEIQGQMPLLCAKDDPQGQGSAITYARRYSLMSLLGITADLDDDAEATRREVPPRVEAARRAERTVNTTPMPSCPEHGPTKLVPAGTSKAGKPYGAFYSCLDGGCKAGNNGRGWTMFEDKWVMQVQMAQGQTDYDPNAPLPFED